MAVIAEQDLFPGQVRFQALQDQIAQIMLQDYVKDPQLKATYGAFVQMHRLLSKLTALNYHTTALFDGYNEWVTREDAPPPATNLSPQQQVETLSLLDDYFRLKAHFKPDPVLPESLLVLHKQVDNLDQAIQRANATDNSERDFAPWAASLLEYMMVLDTLHQEFKAEITPLNVYGFVEACGIFVRGTHVLECLIEDYLSGEFIGQQDKGIDSPRSLIAQYTKRLRRQLRRLVHQSDKFSRRVSKDLKSFNAKNEKIRAGVLEALLLVLLRTGWVHPETLRVDLDSLSALSEQDLERALHSSQNAVGEALKHLMMALKGPYVRRLEIKAVHEGGRSSHQVIQRQVLALSANTATESAALEQTLFILHDHPLFLRVLAIAAAIEGGVRDGDTAEEQRAQQQSVQSDIETIRAYLFSRETFALGPEDFGSIASTAQQAQSALAACSRLLG